jgi:hypothetical protein
MLRYQRQEQAKILKLDSRFSSFTHPTGSKSKNRAKKHFTKKENSKKREMLEMLEYSHAMPYSTLRQMPLSSAHCFCFASMVASRQVHDASSHTVGTKCYASVRSAS